MSYLTAGAIGVNHQGGALSKPPSPGTEEKMGGLESALLEVATAVVPIQKIAAFTG